MSLSSPPAPLRHPAPVVLLHWLSLGAILLALAAVAGRELVDASGPRAALLAIHRQAGLMLLPLLLARLFARWQLGGPRPEADDSSWPALFATLAHAALYLVMALLPLLGWALSDARGQHPALAGLLPLPHFTGTDADLAETLEDRHRWAAWGLGALVALHIGAALWHHWVLRDGVLRTMWPARQALSSTFED